MTQKEWFRGQLELKPLQMKKEDSCLLSTTEQVAITRRKKLTIKIKQQKKTSSDLIERKKECHSIVLYVCSDCGIVQYRKENY